MNIELIEKLTLPDGMFAFEWDSGNASTDLVVHAEYIPECLGSRERGTGLQMEPDQPESFSIVDVFLCGESVIQLLDKSFFPQMLDAARNHWVNHIQDSEMAVEAVGDEP